MRRNKKRNEDKKGFLNAVDRQRGEANKGHHH
jgi:hypothetical protein